MQLVTQVMHIVFVPCHLRRKITKSATGSILIQVKLKVFVERTSVLQIFATCSQEHLPIQQLMKLMNIMKVNKAFGVDSPFVFSAQVIPFGGYLKLSRSFLLGASSLIKLLHSRVQAYLRGKNEPLGYTLHCLINCAVT